jgi:hypothetical protein
LPEQFIKKDDYELFETTVWRQQNTESTKPNSNAASGCHSTAIGLLLELALRI